MGLRLRIRLHAALLVWSGAYYSSGSGRFGHEAGLRLRADLPAPKDVRKSRHDRCPSRPTACLIPVVGAPMRWAVKKAGLWQSTQVLVPFWGAPSKNGKLYDTLCFEVGLHNCSQVTCQRPSAAKPCEFSPCIALPAHSALLSS